MSHSSCDRHPVAGLLIPLMFVCFALLPRAQAVLPAPDGGYPGGNTAEGTNALFSRTSGAYNTAIGLNALLKDTSGSRNTANGANGLRLNTTGVSNTAIGTNTLFVNSGGFDNTAIGDSALFSNTIGNWNTATGFQALLHNATGNFNTANGYLALQNNTTGDVNTATGAGALQNNTTGDGNTATGANALFSSTTDANNNTATGRNALFSNTTGDANVASGYQALLNNITGSQNTALGNGAGSAVTTANNVICIGADGANVDNSCFINNILGVTSAGGAGVFVNSAGRLGTTTSSRRFKDGIKPMEQASEGLFALKPVTFHYKKEIDPQGIPQFGLVAEEVEEVNPDLVVRDGEGKVNTVRYEAVNAMLLNEFLKEHRKVQEQEATIAELKCTTAKQEATAAQQQKEIQALTARLEEQESQIQKVSAQLEVKKPAPRTALNNQ